MCLLLYLLCKSPPHYTRIVIRRSILDCRIGRWLWTLFLLQVRIIPVRYPKSINPETAISYNFYSQTYHNNWFRPLLNANNTKTYKKKNLIISITIRDSDTCSGPKCGFTENIWTSFNELNMLAALNRPSDISIGSHVSHRSRGKSADCKLYTISFFTWK